MGVAVATRWRCSCALLAILRICRRLPCLLSTPYTFPSFGGLSVYEMSSFSQRCSVVVLYRWCHSMFDEPAF